MVFYGDQVPVLNWFALSHAQTFVWYQGAVSTGYNSFAISLPSVGIYAVCGAACASKVGAGVLAAGPGFTMYLFLTGIDSRVAPLANWGARPPLVRKIALAAGAAFFGSTFINQGLVAPLTYSVSYVEIALPLTLLFLLLYVKHGRWWHLLGLGLTVPFLVAFPLSFFFLPLLGVPLLMVSWPGFRKVLTRTILSVSIIMGASAFVWIPTLASYFQISGGIFVSYLSSNAGSASLLQQGSWYTLADAVFVVQPALNTFHSFPTTGTPFNVVLPLAAFSTLLMYRRRVTTLFSVSAALSILLAAGANPPFGFLYVQLAQHMGPFSAIFRNVNLWFIPLTFSYACLFVIFIGSARPPRHLRLKHTSRVTGRATVFSLHLVWTHNPRRESRWGVVTASAIATALVGVVLVGTMGVVGVVAPYYTPHSIPPVYAQLEGELGRNGTNVGVTYYPTGGDYTWQGLAGDVQTNFPETISREVPVSPNTFLSYLPFTTHIGKLMSMLGVQYFVLHNDTTTNTSSVYSELINQTDLRQAWHGPEVSVFATTDNAAQLRTLANLTVVLGGDSYLPFLTDVALPGVRSAAIYFANSIPTYAGDFAGVSSSTTFNFPSKYLATALAFGKSVVWMETNASLVKAAQSEVGQVQGAGQASQVVATPSLLALPSTPDLPGGGYGLLGEPLLNVSIDSPNVGVAPVSSNTTALRLLSSVVGLRAGIASRILVTAIVPQPLCNAGGLLDQGISPTFLALSPKGGAVSSRLTQVSGGFDWQATGRCTALVSFNLTLPSSYVGQAYLVGYYYNKTTYSTVSSVFPVGTIETLGSWVYGRETVAPGLLLASSDVTIPVYFGQSANYNLSAVEDRTEVNESGSISLDISENCSVLLPSTCYVTEGWHNVTIQSGGVSAIRYLLASQLSMKALTADASPAMSEVAETNPTDWSFDLDANGSSLVYLAQQFNSAWALQGGGVAAASIPIDGYGNGFVVNVTGLVHFSLVETGQVWLIWGAAASLITLAAVPVAFVLVLPVSRWVRSRRP